MERENLVSDERARQAALMERKRKKLRDIKIPKCKDPARRERLESDTEEWLRWYFPEKFSNPFTDDQRIIIKELDEGMTGGNDQAIAATRGDGKTAIVEGVATKNICMGVIRFLVIVGATGTAANQIENNIKAGFEYNDRLLADYPEVCAPVRALEGSAQRGNTQTASGERTRIKWTGDYIQFPFVEGSRSSGVILATRAMEKALRGMRIDDKRPDVVIIDDPETEQSAANPETVKKYEDTIERAIGGLGGPNNPLSRIMLCTIQNDFCLAALYTDPTQKPSWNGKRFRFIKEPPKNKELWDKYIDLRVEGLSEGERDTSKADKFYVENRKEMDEGSVVSNEHRYFPKKGELSALQHAYNVIADRGLDAFLTEYQNDPPKDDNIEESEITANLVKRKTNGYDQYVIPDQCQFLTAGIDVGKRAFHWTVTAWEPNATGYVIDYGVAEVHIQGESDSAVEFAITNALHTWRDEVLASPYLKESGIEMPFNYVLVDAGWKTEVIYDFTFETGHNPFWSAMGFGQSVSAKMSTFRKQQKHTKDRRIGDRWALAMKRYGNDGRYVWLTEMDADYWKGWMHDRFLTPVDRPGSLSVYGDIEVYDDVRSKIRNPHTSFSKHITAETEVIEFVKGKGEKRVWKQTNRNNHWLDATYMCCVGASRCGVKLIGNNKGENDKNSDQAA